MGGGVLFFVLISDLFWIFDLWGGGERGPGRFIFSWWWDTWYCFYQQMLVLRECWGAKPSLLSADAGIAGTSHFERLVPLCCAGCCQSCLEGEAPANGIEPRSFT